MDFGWLEVEIDCLNLIIEKYCSILYMLLLLIVVLVINGMIVMCFFICIGDVVECIKLVLNEMGEGNLEVCLLEDVYGELW